MINEQPVIGLSGRGKRFDKVLFTLLHEVAHILLGHLSNNGDVILVDLSAESADYETEADQLASELSISGQLPAVPDRVNSAWIEKHAADLDVAPIILVGRLSKRGKTFLENYLGTQRPKYGSILGKLEGSTSGLSKAQ